MFNLSATCFVQCKTLQKFISLDCIQKGDSKSSCVYGNMFV